MLKIYQSIRAFRLVTEIRVDGTLRTVEFSGGARQPRRRNGIFSTTSKRLQEALEKGSGFNKSYKLIKSLGESEPEIKKEVVQKDVMPTVDDFPEVDELDSKDYASAEEKADYSKVSKVQEARDVLFELDKTLTFNDLRSKTQIFEQAKRLEIAFPNLPK